MRRENRSLNASHGTGPALEPLQIQYRLAFDRLVDAVRFRAGG